MFDVNVGMRNPNLDKCLSSRNQEDYDYVYSKYTYIQCWYPALDQIIVICCISIDATQSKYQF